MNKTKLQNTFLRQLKQINTHRVNINNANYFKIPSRTLFHTVCNNYSMSCANIAHDLDHNREQPVLLNNVITKQHSSIRHNNFSCISHHLKHHWIFSSVILCNGKRHIGHKTYHGSQNYNNIRYFSSTGIDSISEVKVPMQLSGIFKTLSESMPIKIVQDSLLWVHDYTGLPWWLVIVLSTVIMRTTVTLPLSFYQVYIYIYKYHLYNICTIYV